MSTPSFIHLRTHSAFSLLEGAIPVTKLVERCVRDQMPAVALTDTQNLFGAMAFSQAAAEKGIQPILGALLKIAIPEDDPRRTSKAQIGGGASSLLPFDKMSVLVKDHQGYLNLMSLLTTAWQHVKKGEPAHLTLEDFKQHHEGLILLTGGTEGGYGQLLHENQFKAAETYLNKLKSLFGDRLYVEITRQGLPAEPKIEKHLISLADQYQVPLVATNPAFFLDSHMFEAHDALRCIAEGTYISQEDRKKLTPEYRFKNPQEMQTLFKDLPDALQNTVIIAKRCAYRQDTTAPLLPSYPTERTEAEELRLQSEDGLRLRLQTQVFKPNATEDEKEEIEQTYFNRLHHELTIIEKMGFPGYFLIVADFIKFAKSKNIPVGPGRGSGAGSLVAWSLTITDIDPIRFDLLFERFLNPERVSMPDFDVDFCQDRRDEVIDYVREKYGEERVAQIITFGKLQARAVIRDVGRVLQMPYSQVDRISKLIPNNPANPTTLEEAIEGEAELRRMIRDDPTVKRLTDIGKSLEGLYRHASTHAAGVVIGDRPLKELVALYYDPRNATPATQFNMKDVEKAGLVKFDFLGLKTLTVIAYTARYLEKRGININISTISLEDSPTFELLNRVETVGVFQLESTGMSDVLRKLKPTRFEELIALVALYRPGPMDDIPRYLACKHGEEPVSYAHPLMEDILSETFGVMVYQEQVMKVAQVLGGYSLGQADLLRRAMGKKIVSEMDAQREKFTKGAQEKDIPPNLASQIFDAMAKFAGYGFNKSHSAPYALIAYQTAYLKANYPAEFMAASMTLDMGNTDKLSLYKQELDRMGIVLLPPDINKSFSEFAIEKTENGSLAIRYALAALKNVGEGAIDLLTENREQQNEFKDIWDFAGRMDTKVVNKRLMESLIMAGAFDTLHSDRSLLFQNLDKILAYGQAATQQRESNQASLFGGSGSAEQLPQPALINHKPWPHLEKLQREMDTIGFYLSDHPLKIYEDILTEKKIIHAKDLNDYFKGKDSSDFKMAGVMLSKKERISKKGSKFAFVQFSDESGPFEVTLFSEQLAQYRDDLTPGTGFLISLNGRKDEENLRLTALGMENLDLFLQKQSQTIKFVLAHEKELEDLHDLLKNIPDGQTKIVLTLKLEDRDVIIELPKRYAFTPELQAYGKS